MYVAWIKHGFTRISINSCGNHFVLNKAEL